MRTLTSEQLKRAKKLLTEAVQHQIELTNGPMKEELIEGTTPVLWFGDAAKKSWLTVATNPSAGQFLKKDGTLRFDSTGPFFLLSPGMSLEAYLTDIHLEQSIRKFNDYFQQKDVYKTWFGKEQGGKLEGFLNGLGASLYDGSLQSVIHTDFFPLPTKRYMGKISMRHELEANRFWTNLFFETAAIVFITRDHLARTGAHGPFSETGSEYRVARTRSTNRLSGCCRRIWLFG